MFTDAAPANHAATCAAAADESPISPDASSPESTDVTSTSSAAVSDASETSQSLLRHKKRVDHSEECLFSDGEDPFVGK